MIGEAYTTRSRRCSRRRRRGPSGEACRMRFVDEYRDPGRGPRARRPHHRAGRRRPLQVHGGVRRPHPHHLPPRHRARAARQRRAGPRPRLPGVRDPDGPGRRRHRRGRDPGRDLHVLRRHDAGARAATGTCSRPRPAAPTSASSTRPSTRCEIAVENPDRDVVFFAVGFETTAPSTAVTLLRARDAGRHQLQGLLQPRHDRPADQGHPRVARPPPRRLPRPGPRLDRRRATGPTGSCPSSTASRW